MNFQDIVDKNNEQFNIVCELDTFISKVHSARRYITETNNLLFKYCIQNNTSSLCSYVNGRYNELRELLIDIDVYELKDIIRRVNNIYNNYYIETLLNNIEKGYLNIVKFKKIRIDEEKINKYGECLNSLDSIVDSCDKLKLVLLYNNEVNKSLNKGVQNPPLKIRSNIENLDNKTFGNIINPIEKIYAQLCIIANISEVEEPINIVRVESGSITMNFNGNGKICEVIKEIIFKFSNFLVRRFTKEGAKVNIVENLDIIKKEVDIITEMKEAGIDTSIIEKIADETAVNVFKQINLFLLANPDSKINEKSINKAEDVKRLINSIKLLEEAEIDNSND